MLVSSVLLPTRKLAFKVKERLCAREIPFFISTWLSLLRFLRSAITFFLFSNDDVQRQTSPTQRQSCSNICMLENLINTILKKAAKKHRKDFVAMLLFRSIGSTTALWNTRAINSTIIHNEVVKQVVDVQIDGDARGTG